MEIPQDKLKRAKEIIIRAAQEKGRVWYSELYEAIGLDHTNLGDRLIGANILGSISRESNASDGVMLSAIVNGKSDGEPADGFFELAQELGRLSPKASDSEKLTFWVEEFKHCHLLYAYGK